MPDLFMNLRYLIENKLDFDPAFLKRVGGTKGISKLFEKQIAGDNLTDTEAKMYFECMIHISAAYHKQYGRHLFITNSNRSMH